MIQRSILILSYLYNYIISPWFYTKLFYTLFRVKKFRAFRPAVRGRQFLSRENVNNRSTVEIGRRRTRIPPENGIMTNSMNDQNSSPASRSGLLNRRARQFSRAGAFNRMENKSQRQSNNNNKMEDIMPISKFRATRKGFRGRRKTKPLNKEKLDQDLNTYFAKDPQMYKKMLDNQLEHMMDVSNQS